MHYYNLGWAPLKHVADITMRFIGRSGSTVDKRLTSKD